MAHWQNAIQTHSDETRAGSRTRLVHYPKIRLTVVKGPDAGLTVEVSGSLIRVGTSIENDLVLTDPTVSRRHCEMTSCDRGIRVRDEGSTNGVLIGNALVADGILPAAFNLKLGDTCISVSPLAETVCREQVDEDRFGDMLGRSPCMRELFADLLRIAPTDLSLLIEGETGTGKELVAESVHKASLRPDEPFVVFDCSAVAPSLAESDLFGHERGAFTGAVGLRTGVFEQAHGGTIFLDELGDLPKELQPKLLRVIEKREVRRLGGVKPIPVDVRLIAATNRNLQAEVRAGNFREDLYFRVAGAHVYVPPLRERTGDLEMLAESFLAASQPPRTLTDVPQHIWQMFQSYRWPGNVRELKNAVKRVLVTPERSPVQEGRGDATPSLRPSDEEIIALRSARRLASDSFERAYVTRLLARCEGNITDAAALAEVSRQVIHKLISRHGL